MVKNFYPYFTYIRLTLFFCHSFLRPRLPARNLFSFEITNCDFKFYATRNMNLTNVCISLSNIGAIQI